ncbi:MutS-related protein [Mucilaginibacter sp. KACC 22063]|uniref:MutS-related protein n=1 Tax=Mucilaginibacter sp. KACC 22063 TaxID=3025666 RepID=UPI00236720C4|nr:hypothetical protein [Mucilaginibacter sp. KACC 22063]WDF56908.1 hypothetical protein PQ461_07545 [Mucilaginibacter sp. KACC 22063]
MADLSFKTDEQTQRDLALFGATIDRSIISLFTPVTYGGVELLTHLFKNPLADINLIKQRIEAIRYTGEHFDELKFDRDDIDFVEHYLRANRTKKASKLKAYKDKLKYRLMPEHDYYVIERGVMLAVEIFKQLHDLLQQKYHQELTKLLKTAVIKTASLFEGAPSNYKTQSFTAWDTEVWDEWLRKTAYKQVREVLDVIYQLDVYIAVAKKVQNDNYCYPELLEYNSPVLELGGLYHPMLTHPVDNSISFGENSNMCFVTGANMAGKSTLLKAVGIAVYLAHLGFAVPAKSMRTTVFKGLFTTINLSDNINVGHSHFYAEVLRIKQVATLIGELQSIVVIFDELFRGTNVKDAYEGSVAIIRALAKVKGSVFIVSTHITEVAPQLQDLPNVHFKCLRSTIEENEAVYDYKLKDGISDEHLGMRIIEQEGIVNIINSHTEANK